MTKVYRIEYPDTRLGPYNPGDDAWDDLEQFDRMRLATALREAHGWDNPTHEAPQRFVHENERFGFASMRDLFRWFGGYVRPALRAGAVIATYTMPDNAISYRDDYQVAFDSTRATLA